MKKRRIRNCRECKKPFPHLPWRGCCSEECFLKREIALKERRTVKKAKNVIFDPQSDRWLKLRFETLKKFGRQCMCCGAKPPQAIIQVDHIKPRSKHPELTWEPENLQVLCKECNYGKKHFTEDDFRP